MRSERQIKRRLKALKDGYEMVDGGQGRVEAGIRTLQWVIGEEN